MITPNPYQRDIKIVLDLCLFNMKVLQRLEEIDRIEPYGWKGVTYSWGRKSYEMKMFLKERNLLRNVIPREPAG
jgi:hypothetical protein